MNKLTDFVSGLNIGRIFGSIIGTFSVGIIMGTSLTLFYCIFVNKSHTISCNRDLLNYYIKQRTVLLQKILNSHGPYGLKILQHELRMIDNKITEYGKINSDNNKCCVCLENKKVLTDNEEVYICLTCIRDTILFVEAKRQFKEDKIKIEERICINSSD